MRCIFSFINSFLDCQLKQHVLALLQLPLLLILQFRQISCDCGWLHCTVVEHQSLAGELSLVYARLATHAGVNHSLQATA